MARMELKAEPKYMRVGNYRIHGGEAAMTELLALIDRPTAILTANDLTAIGALRVIHRQGLSVPEDISVVGFDDIELSDMVYPPLTTLRLPRHEMAEMVANALDSLSQKPHGEGRQYKIRTTLVVRSSTGPVREGRAGGRSKWTR